MEKIYSLSFYEDRLKYIILHKNKASWALLNHGEIPLKEGCPNIYTLMWKEGQQKLFQRTRLRRNHGFITFEGHHTYLNMRKITTLRKINPREIIRYNYENLLPILFDKDRFFLEYDIEHFSDNSTEISFMGTPQDRKRAMDRLVNEMNIKPMSVKPIYKYFGDLLKLHPSLRGNREYALYIDSSNAFINFVLIRKGNPISKRTLEINGQLGLNIKNYFYSLDHYSSISDFTMYISNTDPKIETLLRNLIPQNLYTSAQRVHELLAESLGFIQAAQEQYLNYQHCFLSLGRVMPIEAWKRKSKA